VNTEGDVRVERQKTVLCLASYEKGQTFIEEMHRRGRSVIFVTREKLR